MENFAVINYTSLRRLDGNHSDYRECLSIFVQAGKGDFDKTVRYSFPFPFILIM